MFGSRSAGDEIDLDERTDSEPGNADAGACGQFALGKIARVGAVHFSIVTIEVRQIDSGHCHIWPADLEAVQNQLRPASEVLHDCRVHQVLAFTAFPASSRRSSPDISFGRRRSRVLGEGFRFLQIFSPSHPKRSGHVIKRRGQYWIR